MAILFIERKGFVWSLGGMMVLIMSTVLLLAGVSAEAADMPKVFKFGTLQSMTGFGAYYGRVETDGQILALEQINSSGEFPFKLEIVVGDHKSDDPVAGLNAARKQITIDKVPWINSSWVATTIAVNPICQENKVVEMNAGGIGEELIGLPWLHNTRLGSSQVVPSLLDYMHNELGVKKLAMIYWNDASGRGFARIAKDVAQEKGMQLVFSEPHERGVKDYRSLIAKIKAANPDGMASWTWGVDLGYIVKQSREARLDIPIVSQDAAPPALEIGGDSMEGLIFGGDMWYPEIDNLFNNQFTQAYSKRFNIEPKKIDVYAAYYYELVYVMRDVLRYVLDKGGDPFDGEQLEKAINEIKLFKTLLADSKMELLPNGMAIKPLFILKVGKGAKFDRVKTVERPMPWAK